MRTRQSRPAATPVSFCPGYARGLAFAGRHAVIGLSRARRNRTFDGLALDERLRAKNADARCGLQIVDIDTGNAIEWLRYEHTVDELYDVAVLPGVRQAEAVGFRADDIQREISPERRECTARSHPPLEGEGRETPSAPREAASGVG